MSLSCTPLSFLSHPPCLGLPSGTFAIVILTVGRLAGVVFMWAQRLILSNHCKLPLVIWNVRRMSVKAVRDRDPEQLLLCFIPLPFATNTTR